MSDLPVFLVGVFPLLLAIGLLVLIARWLPPMDGPQQRPTHSDTPPHVGTARPHRASPATQVAVPDTSRHDAQ